MKTVASIDKAGYKRMFLLRDTDPESMADRGIPLSPPDLNQVDWEGVKRDLHNQLVDAGLFTWQDVQRVQRGVASALMSVLHRRIVDLYKLKDQAAKAAPTTGV